MCDFEALSSDYKQSQFQSSPEVSHLRRGSEISYPFPHKWRLKEDVKQLEQQLQDEMKIRSVLQCAVEKSSFALLSASCLPPYGRELLSTISALEGTVSNLEQQIISLNCQLSEERNGRRLTEFKLKLRVSDASSKSVSPSKVTQETSSSNCPNSCDSITCLKKERLDSHAKATSTETLEETSQRHVEIIKIPRTITKGLLDHPNILSEEMVRCMKNILRSLADSAAPSQASVSDHSASHISPRGHFSSSSWWASSERQPISSWGNSPQLDASSNQHIFATDDVFDPYRVRDKLSWVDIGYYSSATEVSWMSVGKKQLEYASGALRKFRILVEMLAKVNPRNLTNDEKLAFWINLYNALIMHAYLAYGVPRSELKLFSLMQKAAYVVGGHSFSAAAIEYAMLKTKPPLHRPQIALLLALRKVKVTEEQRIFAIEKHEPSLPFALSCGLYSSPAVRIYTAKNVKEELEEAQHDFIRASVGVSKKGKLLLPKVLHCFAKGFVEESKIVTWISSHLPPSQSAFVYHCLVQAPASSRSFGIIPFDSRFRYLFLPDQPIKHLHRFH